MIKFSIKNKLNLMEHWFEKKIKIFNSLNTNYIQCSENKTTLTHIKVLFNTSIIFLEKFSENDLINSFKKNTRNEIRRAEKEGVQFEIEENINRFASFFDAFAKVKGLNELNLIKFKKYEKNLVITKVISNETVLVMHSYVIDPICGRARLLNSATNMEKIDIPNSLISQANRYLHFSDMCYFKELGYVEYDFGGIAINTNNAKLEGINSFKESFNGNLVTEYNYVPFWLWRIRKNVK